MTTSGSYAFDPSAASLMDEAFERAGIDPATISQRHIKSARMSLNLMLTEWAAIDGETLYRMETSTATVASGTNYFDPIAGSFDVTELVVDYASDDVDIALARISRQDYLNIADKTSTGRPTLYYVDQTTLNAPRVYLWPVPDASCAFTYDYLRYVQTMGAISETLDAQRLWLEAIAAGWAAKLAVKYNLDRVALLAPLADRSYRIARSALKGRVEVTITGYGFGSGLRRRRG